ncbi:IS3 family transposase [Actinocorallia sp. A-T 12471]|uniref:IS3 family transposase n=1 Tax=Actinocorallia sp. A-T 12471 TaxID=3089813 RepID=UPI0039B6FB39
MRRSHHYRHSPSLAFWGRMQTELLDRQRWKTRMEIANAIFDYIEGFYNRSRRRSALDQMSPLQFENTTARRD